MEIHSQSLTILTLLYNLYLTCKVTRRPVDILGAKKLKKFFRIGLPAIGFTAIISKIAWILTFDPFWLVLFLIFVTLFLVLWGGFRVVYGQWYPDPFFETKYHTPSEPTKHLKIMK